MQLDWQKRQRILLRRTRGKEARQRNWLGQLKTAVCTLQAAIEGDRDEDELRGNEKKRARGTQSEHVQKTKCIFG